MSHKKFKHTASYLLFAILMSMYGHAAALRGDIGRHLLAWPLSVHCAPHAASQLAHVLALANVHMRCT